MITLKIDNKPTVAQLIIATAKYVIIEVEGLRKSLTPTQYWQATR